MTTRNRKSSARLMWERDAIDQDQFASERKRKVAYMLRMRDQELAREQKWERAHLCEKHNVVLSRTGKCAACELLGGPNG